MRYHTTVVDGMVLWFPTHPGDSIMDLKLEFVSNALCCVTLSAAKELVMGASSPLLGSE
jgi:hypothetical protein